MKQEYKNIAGKPKEHIKLAPPYCASNEEIILINSLKDVQLMLKEHEEIVDTLRQEKWSYVKELKKLGYDFSRKVIPAAFRK